MKGALVGFGVFLGVVLFFFARILCGLCSKKTEDEGDWEDESGSEEEEDEINTPTELSHLNDA